MSITVEFLRHGTVNVITSPSLIRRILFRETERQRVAVCVAAAKGWRWIWDDGKGFVDDATVKLIDRTLIETRRRALAEAAGLENVTFIVLPREDGPERPPTEPPA
jgi:hypothetical protein